MPLGASISMVWYNCPNFSALVRTLMLSISFSSSNGKVLLTFDWWLCIFPFGRMLRTARRNATSALPSRAQASGMSSLNLQIGEAGSRRRRLKSYHNAVMVVISVRGGSLCHSFMMSNRYPPFWLEKNSNRLDATRDGCSSPSSTPWILQANVGGGHCPVSAWIGVDLDE